MRRSLLASSVFLWAVAACNGGSCNGCASFEHIPGGAFTGPRADNAATARVTAQGFSALNQFAPALLQQFAPGGRLEVSIPCTVRSLSLLGSLTIADEGSSGCIAESCGLMDGKCDALDVPRSLPVVVNGLTLAPSAPDLLEATLDVTLSTGLLHVTTVSNSVLCGFPVNRKPKCGVDFNTSRALPDNNALRLGVKMGIDPRWDKVLSLEVTQVNAGVCTGAATPTCLDPDDVLITNEGTTCGSICTTANFDLVKGVLLTQVASALKDAVQQALAGANCQGCADGFCRSSSTATGTCRIPADAGAVDDAGICFDGTTDTCVPFLYGVEGRLPVAALAPGLLPASTALDVSIFAGGGAQGSDAGLTLGFRGGAQEAVGASCVKTLTPPPLPQLPFPDLDLAATAPYDLGLSLSQALLGRVLFSVQQSGALCVDLGPDSLPQLDSKLLATFLPSLDLLTEKKPVPLRVALRPVNAPTVSVGAGTRDASGNLQPLLRVDWRGLEFDVYALLDDRYTRLFTLSSDVSLPLGLDIEGCATLRPVLGALGMVATNVTAKNSELLAEDPATLAGLVPQLVQLAEPALSGALPAFTLPPVQFFQVRLREVKGVENVAGTSTYAHVGIFADLLPRFQLCLPVQPKLRSQLSGRRGDTVTLEVGATGTAEAEYSVRLRGGLWRPFARAQGGTLTFQHPALARGRPQVLEVRARDVATAGVSQPIELAVPAQPE